MKNHKNGIGNPTQKEFIFIQKTWNKGRVADPDPSTKNTRRLPEGFLPEFLRKKTIFLY
jgi:hypothetical protein